MDRVFLDANVLFSAAYREDSGLRDLWRLGGTELITSNYAIREAIANLDNPEQKARLELLIASTEIVAQPASAEGLPSAEDLPEKDRPILLAALAAGATHLLTGDITHFGRFFGRLIGAMRVLKPRDYLNSKRLG